MQDYIYDNKQKILDEKILGLNKQLEEYLLSKDLELNISAIKKLFTDVDTIIVKQFGNQYDISARFSIVYCEGLVNSEIINDNILKPLMTFEIPKSKNIIDSLLNSTLLINEAEKTENFKEIIEAVTYGNTVLFINGCEQALILNTEKFYMRSVAEPEGEKILIGPKEGFTECLTANLSLIHRKLRTNDVKMKIISMGRKSKTNVCVCYIDSIVNKNILKELMFRLNKIDMDGILDINYITEQIKDTRLTPFKTTGITERPDVVAGKILEGRIAVFVDGSPSVMTLPYLFIENFQSPEDYYINFLYASFSRLLRIFAFFLSITIPAFYIAVATYHHEMLPTTFLINIAIERQSVPLPAALEAFIMLIAFELLREAGVRMPSNIGQALSIVGALVIGQAAVQAKLIAAPMIIVVASTGITGLLVPRLTGIVIYLRLVFLALASALGFYGLLTGLSIVLIHVLNLRSFGVSQLTPVFSLKYQDIKDTSIRAPWWNMMLRPKMITKNNKRMEFKGGKSDE